MHHALLDRTSARELLDVFTEKSGTVCPIRSPAHNSRKPKGGQRHELVQIVGSRDRDSSVESISAEPIVIVS